MKFLFSKIPLAALVLVALLGVLSAPVGAAVGQASADFDNARPDKAETSWGRLVADAIRAAARADIALLNAGVLNRGTLRAGDIETEGINALLAYADDEVVVMTITGAQLRAALERAVQAYPTGSSAWLHSSGFTAAFNAQAPINRRITMVRVKGREVEDDASFSVAMPISLAKGGAGYYTIWNDPGAKNAKRLNVTLGNAVAQYISGRGTVAPDTKVRLAAQ